MPWSDDTRCLFCNGKLPLYRRLKQGQFCSQTHQQEYEAQNERLGLERLFETHSNLQAARPKVSAETILGPEPPSARKPASQPSAAFERRDVRSAAQDAHPELIEVFAQHHNEPAPKPDLAVAPPAAPISAGPRGPEEGICLHCGKKLPLFQKLRHGQFCSKAHQAEYAKAQDLLGLERLFETHSNLQALRPQAGAESILGPAPQVGASATPTPDRLVLTEVTPLGSRASSNAILFSAALSNAARPDEALPGTAGVVPGYATKVQQKSPDVIALAPAVASIDAQHYEAVPQIESGRFETCEVHEYANAAALKPAFADRVHLGLGGRLGLDPIAAGQRADLAESLGTLSRSMVSSALQATLVPAQEESFHGSVAIIEMQRTNDRRSAPSLADQVPVDGTAKLPLWSPKAIAPALLPIDAGAAEAEPFRGSFALAFKPDSMHLEQIPRRANLLPVPGTTNSLQSLAAAVEAGAGPVEWRAKWLAPSLPFDFGKTRVPGPTLQAPARFDSLQRLPVDCAGSSLTPVLLEPEAVPVNAPSLSLSDTNAVRRPLTLGDQSRARLVSLVWRSSALALAQAAPSGEESDVWAGSPTESARVTPQLHVTLSEPRVRDNLGCLPLGFAPANEPSPSSVLGLTGADPTTGIVLVLQAGRAVEVAGDAAPLLLDQVCSPGDKLLRLPQAKHSAVVVPPIAMRHGMAGPLDFQAGGAQNLAKPDSRAWDLRGISSIDPALSDLVELPVRKASQAAVLTPPVEAIDPAPLSNAGVASSMDRLAGGALKPCSGNRTCKLLQPLMVLFRLAYLRNSRPVEFAGRLQGNLLPELEPGQAILPKFRGTPESSLGISIEQAAASPMEFAARPAVGAFSAWTGFWHSAPRDLKILLVSIPLLAAMAFSPALPKVSVHAPEGDGISGRFGKAVSVQLASLRKTVLERAAVALDEDFRQGLDEWVGKGGATTEWSFDETGFVRPGPLALYRPSRGLTDYKMEFLGLIDNKALSWVVRAVDFQNYYVIKLAVVKPGLVPELELTRYAVIDGKPQDRKDTPVYLRGRGDLPYRVSVNLEGDKFSVYVQNLLMDSWNEPRLTHGGIGFFTAHGEQSRVRWVQVTHQYDTLGRLCAFLAPNEFSNTPEDR